MNLQKGINMTLKNRHSLFFRYLGYLGTCEVYQNSWVLGLRVSGSHASSS